MNKKNILETARFVYFGYPYFQERFKFSEIVSLVDRMERNIIIIKNKGEIEGIGMYFMIDDITLKRIKSFVINLSKEEGLNELFNRPGKNLHFIGVIALNVKTILKGLKILEKKLRPRTISWFKPNMYDFRMIKGVI